MAPLPRTSASPRSAIEHSLTKSSKIAKSAKVAKFVRTRVDQTPSSAEIPDYVFGMGRYGHRIATMRTIASCYCQRYTQRTTKTTLLGILGHVEKHVTQLERLVIRQWLSSFHKNPDDLVQSLNATQGSDDDGEDEDEGSRMEDTDDEETGQGEAASRAMELDLLRECGICTDDLPIASFPDHKLTNFCDHKITSCTDCLSKAISAQISDKGWDRITCPDCPALLCYDVVKQWASEFAFLVYDKKSLLAAFQDMPGFMMCLGPNCGSGQIHSGGDEEPIMTCESCNFKTCFIHKMPWHEEQTCAQYEAANRERAAQEEASAALIAATTKTCPNPSCGHGITKVGGCDHMTCKRCSHEFCWLCFVPYAIISQIGNTAHLKTCDYHPENLNINSEDEAIARQQQEEPESEDDDEEQEILPIINRDDEIEDNDEV